MGIGKVESLHLTIDSDGVTIPVIEHGPGMMCEDRHNEHGKAYDKTKNS